MEELNKLEWVMNSTDEIQTPLANSGSTFENSLSRDCPTNFTNINIPPLINVSINRDQLSFIQGTVQQQAAGNTSWNTNNNNSNPIDLNFGAGIADLNRMSYDMKERYEESSSKRQGGPKIANNKGLVLPAQDHIIAERRRREKLNQRFIELSSVIPSLEKIDKASILVNAVTYIKELQQKAKSLEAKIPKPIESAVLVKNSCISSKADDPGCSSSTEPRPLPEIEVRLSGDKILISIHYENIKGLLVNVLSELEELNFDVTHTNVMPFSSSTSFMTLHAQMEEGLNITVDDVLRKLDSAIHRLRND